MRVWDNESDEKLEINILPMIDVISLCRRCFGRVSKGYR